MAYGGLDYEAKVPIAEQPQELTAVEFTALTADGEKKQLVCYKICILYFTTCSALGTRSSYDARARPFRPIAVRAVLDDQQNRITTHLSGQSIALIPAVSL